MDERKQERVMVGRKPSIVYLELKHYVFFVCFQIKALLVLRLCKLHLFGANYLKFLVYNKAWMIGLCLMLQVHVCFTFVCSIFYPPVTRWWHYMLDESSLT